MPRPPFGHRWEHCEQEGSQLPFSPLQLLLRKQEALSAHLSLCAGEQAAVRWRGALSEGAADRLCHRPAVCGGGGRQSRERAELRLSVA